MTPPTAPAPRPAASWRAPALLLAALLAAAPLSGCGMFRWLGSEKDPNPPTALPKNPPAEVAIRTLWQARIGQGSGGKALALTPAVSGGRVYVAESRGRVAALDAASGRLVWERETKLPFSGGPEVSGENLALGTSNGEVVLLATRDGAQRWLARVASEVLSVPRIIGDLVVVHTIDDTIYGLALADGAERWRFNVPAPVLTLRGSASPVVTREGVLVGISGGRLVHLDLTDGGPLWEVVVTPPTGRSELDRIADLDADPVVVGDTAYVAAYNGDLAAVDLVLGSVLWRRTLSAHAGLAADAEALYITDSTDHLWSADPADGAGRWQLEDLAYRRLSGPALVGNALVVGDIDGYVHWVSRRDGRLLGFARVAKARIRATPVVADGRVFVYADDGTLAAVTAGGAAPAREPRPAPADADLPGDTGLGTSPADATADTADTATRPARRRPRPAPPTVPEAVSESTPATDAPPRPLPVD